MQFLIAITDSPSSYFFLSGFQMDTHKTIAFTISPLTKAKSRANQGPFASNRVSRVVLGSQALTLLLMFCSTCNGAPGTSSSAQEALADVGELPGAEDLMRTRNTSRLSDLVT